MRKPASTVHRSDMLAAAALVCALVLPACGMHRHERGDDRAQTTGTTAFSLREAIMECDTVLYVSPSGSDDHSGEESAPFRTITKALSVAGPGTGIVVRAGLYPESVDVPCSGTPDKPVIITGERGPDGEWLSVLDAARPVAVSWEPAPEVGDGVFKTTDIPFEPCYMDVAGKQLPRIWPTHMRSGKGFEHLAFAEDHTVETHFLKAEVKYWDIIEAMYGWKDGVTYIRFRHGDEPAQKDLRAAPAGGGIKIENRRHVVFQNLLVRGGESCVLITGKDATDNVIENCCLTNGSRRVFITGGAARNGIESNLITVEFYGGHFEPGPWGGPRGDAAPYLSRVREHFYNQYKWFFGPNSTSDYGVRIYEAGPGNEVVNNHVFRGGQGISVSRTSDTSIHRNTVHCFSSIGIICTLNRVFNIRIHDNLVHECNINLRIHHVNEPKETADRSLYVYRNRFHLRPGAGGHIYFHYYKENDPEDYNHPYIYIYHNSFAGGNAGISVSGFADNCGGLPRTMLVNNILSSSNNLSVSQVFIRTPGMVGAIDGNWIGGQFKTAHKGHDYRTAEWFGKNNILRLGERIWADGDLPDFHLPPDCEARSAGIDLSVPFTVNGTEHAPLPGMVPGYFTGSQPDLGAVQR